MKKFMTVFIAILLVVSALYVTAFAQTNSDKIGSEDAFQKIRDKINAEYGTNIRPATDEELKLLGVSRADIQKKLSNVTPAQYEADLLESVKAAEKEKIISQDALDKAKKAGISEKDFMPITVSGNVTPLATVPVLVSKPITGAISYLDSEIITTGTPAPRWGTVNYSYTQTGPALGISPPYYGATSWAYQRLDAGRTIAVAYLGNTYDANWNVTATSVYRYVEFYAFNP